MNDEPHPATTLPGELAVQISRVSLILGEYRDAAKIAGPQANFAPAIFMMERSLKAAIEAAGSPDIVGQLQSVEDLKGYSL